MNAAATAPRWRGLFRFSLKQLLLATALAAVGCYALRWASPWWAIVLFYTGLSLIVAGILIAINRGGESRSFWAGFSICGIAHMLLVFQSGSSNTMGVANSIPLLYPAPSVTARASAWTYQLVQPARPSHQIASPEANLMKSQAEPDITCRERNFGAR